MNLFADHNLPFSVALVLMAVLAIIQLVGLGDFGPDVDIDSDPDVEIDGGLGSVGFADGLVSIIGMGRVPFTIWLACLLMVFSGIGFGIQALAEGLLGAPLYGLLAAAIAGVAALPATGMIVRPLGRLLPRDETTAVNVDTLVGRRAMISIGNAEHKSPARGQVVDRHGRIHQVMIEPHDITQVLITGEEVLLVRREGDTFFAVTLADRQLAPTL